MLVDEIIGTFYYHELCCVYRAKDKPRHTRLERHIILCCIILEDEIIRTFLIVLCCVVKEAKATLDRRCIVVIVVCCRQGESAGVLGAVAVH